MSVRIGFLGVAHAHPAIDAGNLRALGVDLVGVADDDDPVRRREFATRLGVPELTIAELVSLAPDAVIVTARTALVPSLLPAVINAVSTVFVNKVVAATDSQLAALDALDGEFGTATPLAFAPTISGIKLMSEGLHGDEPSMESLDRLLAWLTEHAEEIGC